VKNCEGWAEMKLSFDGVILSSIVDLLVKIPKVQVASKSFASRRKSNNNNLKIHSPNNLKAALKAHSFPPTLHYKHTNHARAPHTFFIWQLKKLSNPKIRNSGTCSLASLFELLGLVAEI
jgi:hypothetical protein